MTGPNFFTDTPEITFLPEAPRAFKFGEVVVPPGFIGSDGALLADYRGTPMRKRVVMDGYWPGSDASNYVITVTLNEGGDDITMMGSTDDVRQSVSLREYVPPQKLMDMLLRYKVGGTDALTSDNPQTRGRAKLFVMDIVEQYVSDKRARGEQLTEAQAAAYIARRQREQEKGKYLMNDMDFFFKPELLAGVDTSALLACLD